MIPGNWKGQRKEMALFDFLNKKKGEPPIAEKDKPYYFPDEYYPDITHKGTVFEKKVIPFEERKKISYPSRGGLYVAEILLLEYCSYGTYPHPKSGYPRFWWFEYGIRNVDVMLDSLKSRGFLQEDRAIDQFPRMTIPQIKELAGRLGIAVSGTKAEIVSTILEQTTPQLLEQAIPERKYMLAEKGTQELEENGYIPYMHKTKKKTLEDTRFGPEFNVWSINRILGTTHNAD